MFMKSKRAALRAILHGRHKAVDNCSVIRIISIQIGTIQTNYIPIETDPF